MSSKKPNKIIINLIARFAARRAKTDSVTKQNRVQMQTPLSVKKIELQTKSPARSQVTSPVESSDEMTVPRENSMLRQLTRRPDFIINQNKSDSDEPKTGTVSGLTQNRHSSIVSDSKLTQQYSQMWDNEEDRQRVMARFRSFDMTGMTKYNSYNQRSPSQISKEQPSTEQQDPYMSNMNVAQELAKGGGSDSKQQILNIITKLPSINATTDPSSLDATQSPGPGIMSPAQQTAQQLAQGNMMFTLQQQKNFVKHNTNNVVSNAQQVPTSLKLQHNDSPIRGTLIAATEASSYLDRQQMRMQGAQQASQVNAGIFSPGGQALATMVPASKDQSFVSFNQQSNSMNQQLGTTDTSAAAFSNVSPGSHPPVSPNVKYEKPQEKFFRQAHLGVKVGNEIKMENHYDLKNYRLNNKKLKYGLPGEQKAKFYEKSYEDREKIDQKKLDKYVEKIYGLEGNLQLALKENYNQGQEGDDRGSKAATNFDQVKQLVMQTAKDQIAHSQRLKPLGTIKETRFDTPKDQSRQHYSVQAILAQAKTEAEQLHMKESPFQATKNQKFPGRIMAGMESVQQLMPYKGSQTARAFAPPANSAILPPPEEMQTHLPQEVAKFLQQKSGATRRPARLQTLSAQVKHGRKFIDSSLTNQRVRHFSLFPRANKIAQDALKFKNVSDNITLQKLSKDVTETMKGKQSVTCLTGTGNQAGLLSKYDDFKAVDRNNPFTVEEYYFLRNNLQTIQTQKPRNQTLATLDSVQSLHGSSQAQTMRKSMREFARDNDVIHVTIDKQSLAQLTKLSERDIKRDENVKLVTKRSGEGPFHDTKKDDLPLEDDPNIKTMYGTFNAGRTGAPSQLSASAPEVRAVVDKLKSGQTTTDGPLDTASHGTTVQEKKLQPRSSLFNNEVANSAGQGTPIVFGVTSTNDQFNKNRSSSFEKANNEKNQDNLNKTQPGPPQAGQTIISSINRTSRAGKQGGPSERERQSKVSKITSESPKSRASKNKQAPNETQRSTKISILVDDEKRVLQKLNMDQVDQKSQDQTEEEKEEADADRVLMKDGQKASSPSQNSGPVPIFSKINPNSTRQIESLQSLVKSDTDGTQKDELQDQEQQKHPSGSQTPIPQTSPHKAPTPALGSTHGASMPETEELPSKADGDQTAMLPDRSRSADEMGEVPITAQLTPTVEQELDTPLNQQEFAGRPATQELMSVVENDYPDRELAQDAPDKGGETTEGKSQQESQPKVLLNVDSTLLKLTSASASDDKVNIQPMTAEEPDGGQAIVLVSRSNIELETANFIRVDGQTENGMTEVADDEHMGKTMQKSEMRGTRVSIKLDDQEISDLEAEDIKELERFNEMSLPNKRDYISKMSARKSGFKTPGMIMDDLIDKRIQELDQKFSQINFGQAITHQTFEPFVPKKLTSEENEAEYRKWKLRQVILKQYQFEERVERFQKNLSKFKQNKQRIHDFRKLAVQGYDKQAIQDRESQLMNKSGSQLLFLDGKGNLHSSSSKQLQELFWPSGTNYKGVDLRNEIEHKVRQLLGRTELSEIASTAKVLVEISDQQEGKQNIFNATNDTHLQSSGPSSPSGLQTSKINLSPRQTSKSRILNQVKSAV